MPYGRRSRPTLDTVVEACHVSTIEDLSFHWLVGLLEGEGTFVAGPPSSPRTPVVRVEMTDRDVVERVGALWQRSVITNRPRKSHHKTPYSTCIKGRPAIELMRAVRPFVSHVRQAQIDRAIRLSGRRTPFLELRGHLSAHRTHLSRPQSLAWLAGLLEGEGCFTINRSSAEIGYPVIKLNMCSEETVRRAARLMRMPSVTRDEPDNERWNPTYVAAIAGNEAAEWMRRLRPLMGIRRRAAIDAALGAYRPIYLVEAPKICVVPDCGEPHRSRGLCHKHYMSWSRDIAKGRTPRVTPLR